MATAASAFAVPSASREETAPVSTQIASSAPRARHSRRPVFVRSGPTETTVTVPAPFDSFVRRASSSAYSSYGETIHFTSDSSIDFPSGAILILVSVSGTYATATSEFMSWGYSMLLKIRQPFVPPNPKEFDSAYRIFARRASLGT